MDLNSLKDEEYYAHLKELFKTPGWKIFMAECMANATEVNSVEYTKDLDDLWFRKGQLAVLGNILNTENSIRLAEQEALADASQDS